MIVKSVSFKILLLIVLAFIFTAVAVINLANYQLTRIIDKSQTEIFAEKLDALLTVLQKSYDEIEEIGMAEAYKTEAQDEVIAALRAQYYRSDEQQIYPFLIDGQGNVVMHPELVRGDTSLVDLEFIHTMLELQHGDLEYNYNGQSKWMSFSPFEKWDWIVGYTIPLDLKYADVHQFRKSLILIMAAITGLIFIGLGMVVMRFMRPIKRLTTAANELRWAILTMLSASGGRTRSEAWRRALRQCGMP